jgi:FKBP-type peptidyl-prolyl cis-trans isomerase FklB
MKFKIGVLLAGLVVASACNNSKVATTSTELKTDLDSFSYGIGLDIALSIKERKVSSLNLDATLMGLKEGMEQDSNHTINSEEIRDVIIGYLEKVSRKEGEEFLAAKALEEGVQKTSSGLLYKVIKEGEGRKPNLTDTVICHYEGKLIDGSIFDSSIKRNQPATFPLNGVIQGWIEGLQLMNEGSIYKFYIPSDLAYGPRGNRGIPPNSVLEFDVELITVK